MHETRDEIELTFDGLLARAGLFLARIARFPFDWGVEDYSSCSTQHEQREGAGMPGPGSTRNRHFTEHTNQNPYHPKSVIPESSKAISGTQKNSNPGYTGSRVLARDDATSDRSIFPHLFRFDARRLKGMINRAEHMLRCLIIWKAYRIMRDEGVKPVRCGSPWLHKQGAGGSSLEPALCELKARESNRKHLEPVPCEAALHGNNQKPPPIHPVFALRGLPLYDLKPPPFCISMPEERSSLRRQGSGFDAPDSRLRGNEREFGYNTHESKQRKPRNDDLSYDQRLYMRLERLDAIYETINTRARRLASRWAGRMQAAELSRSAAQNRDPEARGTPDLPAWARPEIRPLKTFNPPPELLTGAGEDETEYIDILHDAAFRAAEEFTALCG